MPIHSINCLLMLSCNCADSHLPKKAESTTLSHSAHSVTLLLESFVSQNNHWTSRRKRTARLHPSITRRHLKSFPSASPTIRRPPPSSSRQQPSSTRNKTESHPNTIPAVPPDRPETLISVGYTARATCTFADCLKPPTPVAASRVRTVRQ